MKIKLSKVIPLGFTIYAFISFIISFYTRPVHPWILSLSVPIQSDIDFFFSFIDNFPILYEKIIWGFYPVIYLPSFLLYFYPFYLTNIPVAFILASIINIICVYFIIEIVFKQKKIYFKISIIIMIIATYTLSQWGNPELVVTLVTVYVFNYISKNKEYKIWHIILLAFFSFKIINIIILFPILTELGFKKTLKFALILLGFIFLFNFWYLIINFESFNFAFIIDILSNQPTAIQNVLYFIARTSFSLPLLYGISNCVQKILRKRMEN